MSERISHRTNPFGYNNDNNDDNNDDNDNDNNDDNDDNDSYNSTTGPNLQPCDSSTVAARQR